MRILFLSRWYPYPADNGSKIRIFNLIKHLSSHHEVDLISFVSETPVEEHLAAMRHYCRWVETVPYRPFQADRLKAILGFFSWQPRSVIDTFSVEMQKCVERAGLNHPVDLVIASQIDTAPYALALPALPKILEELEMTTLYEPFARQHHLLKKFRSGLTWWKLVHYISRLLPAFAGCTVVSEEEGQRIRQILPEYRSIAVVPNGVDTTHHTNQPGSPAADTLIYTGALTYDANFDAMEYFLHEIFPLIQAERPEVKMVITGKLDGVPVERLPRHQGVTFSGYLPDIRPAVAHSWVSVVPLRLGGGTRLKILESLALGTPVVATSKGAEGLAVVPGRDLLIADKPGDFAKAVLQLLRDPAQRERLSQNGRRVVETQYDWQTIGQQLSDFVEMVATQKSKVSVG